VCAIEAGLTRPWLFNTFTPPGRDEGATPLIGVTIQVVAQSLNARPFEPNELPDVRPSLSTGPYRVDVWFPLHDSRVRGPEVVRGVQQSGKSLDRRLAGFPECLEISLGSIPLMPCSRLHLYFAEAVVRTSFRAFRNLEFEKWLRAELRRRTAAELLAIAGLKATC
jgi:hypothetical protein